jgi:hypothetical protein
MSRGHVAGTLQTGVQPLQAFPTGQSLTGYAEHVYEQPEGEPPVETNAIRYWRDWAGLRNGQVELRLNNQRAPRVHGLGWGLDPDAGVWRPLRVDSTGALVISGGPTPPELLPPTAQLSAWYRASDVNQANGTPVYTWTDRSGNGADLGPTFGGGLTPPTLVTGSVDFNGLNVLSLDGTQGLYRPLPPGYQGADSAFSLYIVCKPTVGMTRVAFGWGQPFPGDAVIANWTLNGAQTVVEQGDGASMGSPQFVTNNNAQIFAGYLGHAQDIQTQSEVTIDGAVPANLGGGAPGVLSIPVPVPEARLGSYFGTPATNFVGLIAEILVYHKEHNASERAQTLAYLSARYAIPV